jgi:hypothetical protein
MKETKMATTTTAVAKAEKAQKKPVSQSYWSLVWWKFKKNRGSRRRNSSHFDLRIFVLFRNSSRHML